MAKSAACASLEELRAFTAGKLDEIDVSRLEAHLADCADCLETLSQLSSDGTLVAAMRAGKRSDDSSTLVGTQTNAAIERMAARAAENEVDRFEITQREDREVTEEIQRWRENAAFAPGTLIGEYEILAEIARGGMGIVFKAKHTKLKRIVALKMILMGDLATPELVERFLAEAKAAARLEHPGIVPVYEIDQHGTRHFFVMKYVEGSSLSEQLKRGRMDSKGAAKTVRQIALAVQYAHEKEVIHRDIKPGNILINQDGQPVVTDFGLAKQLDASMHLSVTGQILGTPSYMAPEQASGHIRQIGPATDVYALGAVLYAMLTGGPPFQAGSPIATIQQVIHQEPITPRSLVNGLSLDLDTICLKCLAKEPQRRYPTAAALAEDLRRYLDGQPIVARPLSPFGRAWRWCRRNSLVASLILAVASSLVVGTVVAVLFAIDARKEALRANRKEHEAQEQTKLLGDQKKQTDAALEHSEWLLYASQINSAYREWEANKVDLAWNHLNACRQDFRGWEHDMLYTLFTERQRTYRGSYAAMTSDSTKFVMLGDNNKVSIWDREIEQTLATLEGELTHAYQMRFSPNGRLIALGDQASIRVWDAVTGKLKHTLQGVPWGRLTFSRDGDQLAAVAQNFGVANARINDVSVWQVESGQLLQTLKHPAHVLSLDFHPTAPQIATSCADGVLRIWDATTGKEIRSWKGLSDPPFGGALQYHPNGNAIVGWHGQTVFRWNAESGELIDQFNFSKQVASLAMSHDGQHFAWNSDAQTIHVHDMTTGAETVVLKGHNYLLSFAFSPDDEWLTSLGMDRTFKRWDWHALADHLEVNGSSVGGHTRAVFSPDNHHAAFGGWQGLEIRDVTNGNLIASLSGHTNGVGRVVFSPDGKRLVSLDGTNIIRVSDAMTGAELSKSQEQTPVTHCAVNSDGSRLVVAHPGGLYDIWNMANGTKTVGLNGPDNIVGELRFHQDDRRLIGVTHDNQLKVWDVETGKVIRSQNGPSAWVSAVAFDPDLKRVICGVNQNEEQGGPVIKVWDVETGRERLSLKGHLQSITHLAVSPDGKRIFSVSFDQMLKVWNAENGQELLTLPGYSYVAVSSDGKRVISIPNGGPTKIWNAARKQSDAPDSPFPLPGGGFF